MKIGRGLNARTVTCYLNNSNGPYFSNTFSISLVLFIVLIEVHNKEKKQNFDFIYYTSVTFVAIEKYG